MSRYEPFIRTIRQFATERGNLPVEVGTDWASVSKPDDIAVEVSFHLGADEVTPYFSGDVYEYEDGKPDYLASSFGSTREDLYHFLTTHLG